MKKRNSSELIIKYDGYLNQVDANTLLISLLNMTQALNDINEYLNEIHSSHNKLEIKIEAFSKGSFLVNLNLYLEHIKDFINTVSSQEVNNIIYSFIGIIVLKKLLGKKKPKFTIKISKDEIKIENDKGDTTIINTDVFKLYNSYESLHNKITNGFNAINEDNSIKSVEFILNKSKLIEINKDHFPILSEKIEIEDLEKLEMYLKM